MPMLLALYINFWEGGGDGRFILLIRKIILKISPGSRWTPSRILQSKSYHSSKSSSPFLTPGQAGELNAQAWGAAVGLQDCTQHSSGCWGPNQDEPSVPAPTLLSFSFSRRVTKKLLPNKLNVVALAKDPKHCYCNLGEGQCGEN